MLMRLSALKTHSFICTKFDRQRPKLVRKKAIVMPFNVTWLYNHMKYNDLKWFINLARLKHTQY